MAIFSIIAPTGTTSWTHVETEGEEITSLQMSHEFPVSIAIKRKRLTGTQDTHI